MSNRYCAILGFNSKKWWAYDEKEDEFIDPPKEVLKEINQKGGDWRENPDKAENYFNKLLAKEPSWLNDVNYRFSSDKVDI